MNHFAKIAAQLESRDLDGMLLTCEANRFYASGFHSTGTDGVALVTREGNFYFTDSRYIEAAHNKVQDAEIAMTDAAHPYVDLINAAMEKTHVQKLGFEDAYMTVADYRHYSEKLHCQLVPATELLISLRQSKDDRRPAHRGEGPLRHLPRDQARRHREGDRRPAAVSDAGRRRGEYVL